jgi:hypothetical protein
MFTDCMLSIIPTIVVGIRLSIAARRRLTTSNPNRHEETLERVHSRRAQGRRRRSEIKFMRILFSMMIIFVRQTAALAGVMFDWLYYSLIKTANKKIVLKMGLAQPRIHQTSSFSVPLCKGDTRRIDSPISRVMSTRLSAISSRATPN